MQLSKTIPMCGHYIPAHIEMYFDEFRKMLDFEALNPDGIINMFMPDMTLMELVMGPSNST